MRRRTPALKSSSAEVRRSSCSIEILLTGAAEKYLLALKCILAAHAIDHADPILHQQVFRLRHTLNTLPKDSLSAKTAEIIHSEFEPHCSKDENLKKWNEAFLEAHKTSIAHVQAGLKVRTMVDSTTKEKNEQQLLKTMELSSAQLKDAVNGFDLLHEWKSSSEVREKYKEAAHKRWTEASAFSDK